MKNVKMIDMSSTLDNMTPQKKDELLEHLLELSILQAAFIDASFDMHKWIKANYSTPKKVKKAMKLHKQAGQTLLNNMPVNYSICEAKSEKEMRQMVKDLSCDIKIENRGDGWKH